MPVTASDGIHDTVVTALSRRMVPLPSGTAAARYAAGARDDDGGGWFSARWCATERPGCQHPGRTGSNPACKPRPMRLESHLVTDLQEIGRAGGEAAARISVFLADDSLLVREGV